MEIPLLVLLPMLFRENKPGLFLTSDVLDHWDLASRGGHAVCMLGLKFPALFCRKEQCNELSFSLRMAAMSHSCLFPAAFGKQSLFHHPPV